MNDVKETIIQNRKYRIVRCQTCGKVFNAFQGGNPCGIFYRCIENGCRTKDAGFLKPVSKEEAASFIQEELESYNHFSGNTHRQFMETFGPEETNL